MCLDNVLGRLASIAFLVEHFENDTGGASFMNDMSSSLIVT
jgi:hypothetical protein